MHTQIKSNPYLKNCASSTFSVLFNDAKPENEIEFVHGLLDYANFTPTVDLFQYISNIDRLRKNKKLFFVFDASTEGFSPYEYYFFDILYTNCEKYSIPPKKVIFVSANMQDYKNIKKYNKKNKIKDSIIVFCYLSFKSTVRDLIEQEEGTGFTVEDYLKKQYKNNKKLFKDKIVLSLSRVNRMYRSYGVYSLWESQIRKHCLLSHNTMSQSELNHFKKTFEISQKSVSHWGDNLPLVADINDFTTNHALSLGSHLYNSTLFQIVNETSVDNKNNTSLFYSEKTFKPIAHFQPFLIWGQRDCNKSLEEYGFKLYHELFNYDFDSIKNNKHRYDALKNSVTNTVNQITRLSSKKQLEWRWSCTEKLVHNFEVLLKKENELKQFRELHRKLDGLF